MNDSDTLKNADRKQDYCYYKVSDGEHEFEDSLSHNGLVNFDDWSGLNIKMLIQKKLEKQVSKHYHLIQWMIRNALCVLGVPQSLIHDMSEQEEDKSKAVAPKEDALDMNYVNAEIYVM